MSETQRNDSETTGDKANKDEVYIKQEFMDSEEYSQINNENMNDGNEDFGSTSKVIHVWSI